MIATSRREGGDLPRMRRQVAFDRLLCRLFAKQDSPWLLKGGYAMELRIKSARTTRDIDLALRSMPGGGSQWDDMAVRRLLQELADADLGDGFEFSIGEPTMDLDAAPGAQDPLSPEARERIKELRSSLLSGRSIDWQLLEPLLRIPHDAAYRPPQHEHGTHVAGILAADWRKTDEEMPDENDLVGMCPDLELYDLRVLDEKGEGDEFTVIAALQFVRYLNAHKDELMIHGVNLSLAIRHDVANYACGRTPVCEECERLVGNRVIVVAAAGNEGYTQYLTAQGAAETYRSISVTDPGNAEGVITVGATHRYKPHTYGVSYFSSRGPTGDGRYKPDVVAPGEKIKAPIPEGKLKTLDGTSMATPHVSGGAALLLARHRELIGEPARVKQILCKTAVDLGRERYFQGSGMVDILRALQSV